MSFWVYLCCILIAIQCSRIPQEFLPKYSSCRNETVYDKKCYCVAENWDSIPWNIDILMSFVNFNKFYERISYENYIFKMVYPHFTYYHFKHYDYLKNAQLPHPLPEPKIPLILHRIWIVHPDKNSEFPKTYLEYMLSDLKTLGKKWKYYIWYYKKMLDTNTVSVLKQNFGNSLEFHDIESLNLSSDYKNELKDQYEKRIFNCMADSLRLHIIVQFGGTYLDTDVILKDDITRFNYLTKMVMISHPMFLFHHFIMSAPQYHPELLLNVTYAHRNNYNPIFSEYYKHVDDSQPELILLCRHHLWTKVYDHRADRSYAKGKVSSNLRLHSHDLYMLTKKSYLPYYGDSYAIIESDFKYLNEQVTVYREDMADKMKGIALDIKNNNKGVQCCHSYI